MISDFIMMIMLGSLDLHTLNQVTNEDPCAGLDPTKPPFVQPAMTYGYLFETPRNSTMSLGNEHLKRPQQPRA